VEEYCATVPEQLNEEEAEQYWDIQWAMHDPEVQRLYPDKVVAVHKRKVVAAGDWEKDVLDEAERVTGLPRNKITVATIFGPKIMLGDD
jgi:hypothetical protein